MLYAGGAEGKGGMGQRSLPGVFTNPGHDLYAGGAEGKGGMGQRSPPGVFTKPGHDLQQGCDSSAFTRISVEQKLKSVFDDDHFRGGKK